MKNQDTRTFKIDPSIEMKPVRFKNRLALSWQAISICRKITRRRKTRPSLWPVPSAR